MKTATTLVCCLLAFGLFAQHGTLKESLKMKSTVLGHEVEYSVYLPFDYQTSDRSYPVLYLLHGYTDDETGWVQFGESNYIADRAIASGEAPPMIIVTPDAGVSWYVNSHDGKERWEDFFINEFVPNVEKGFRIRAKKEFRAIAGLSMGGHGSLIMALKHPDMFAACAPLSAAVLTEDEIMNMPQDRWDTIFGPPFGKWQESKGHVSSHFQQNNTLDIVKNTDPEQLKKVRYYIDCGDKDFLIKGNMALHALMIDKGIPHEFRVREGVHDWKYWRTALPEVLKFVGESFHR